MIKPRALRPGDRIALVSPASPFSREEFEKGVEELRRLGYQPVYDESVFERALFTSGSAQLRASAFVRAWSDPSIAALVAVRGGYGSVQLLPEIAHWTPQQTPKLFVAYSDNTSLLSWLTCQCGVTALHGPMVEGRLSRGRAGYDETSFARLVGGAGVGLEMRPDGLLTLRDGEASGPLFGGTLVPLTASLGTPYAFDPPEGCVLFLEDVGERPYRIDRMLTQLKLSGILSRARALIFGEMRGCDEPNGAPTAREAVEAFLKDTAIPVVMGFPSGHTSGPCWSLPLGVRVRVVAGRQPSIAVEESPVA
ncbi:MAG: LD-carboxypeptidase [Acidobacteria bacterium]|nr:LD-carboxypeptidase [Acidobacteriota bacterium]